MKTTIKALDHYDHLQAGRSYSVRVLEGCRLIACTDVLSQQIVSLYKWQLDDALLRGKVVYSDAPILPSMSCTASAQLCKKLDSGYAY